MSSVTADPFGTARLRAAVLDSWRSSPTRFREDANVEEDYALGSYRDRLVVELAQNASDAARAAGVPGRLYLRLDDDGLVAANVGAPLDRAGVESLSAMRASSKPEGSVGRFGVGFAAVLAVSDAPEVWSRDGGVRFDRSATAQLLAEDATLSSLVDGRRPPALRVPFPVDTAPPDGYDTAVFLPWRDAGAQEFGLAAVAAIDEVLLLALPLLDEVVLEVLRNGHVERHVWRVDRAATPLVVHHDDERSCWRVAVISGGVSEADEESLPHEEMLRRQWSATVAVPVTKDGLPRALPEALARVVHAPTPTDEPWSLPVVAIGDFRLDSSRRRIVEGVRTDVVADALATAYASLVMDLAREQGAAALSLVPPAALVGPIDHRVREAVRTRLASSRWVPRAHDAELSTPSGLVALEPAEPSVTRVLAEHVVDLADPDWVGGELRSLGLVVRPLHEVWDTLAPLDIAPTQWLAIYEAVQRLDRLALEGLPVPLADGRVLRGLRTAMLAGGHGS
ncbi:MAG: molecular chaperone Hsp90, partial [Actinomycetia bacterium]|nr:molecular chaperone Hsp90 [Actinomycetes bacterium]